MKARKSAGPKKSKRQTIRSKHWQKSTSIAADKDQAIARTILAALPKMGVPCIEMMGKVEARLPKFEGSLWG